MKKIKKYIIIIICLIFILLAIILFLNSKFVTEKSNEKYSDVEESELNTDTKITKVLDVKEYYTVKTILDSYVENYLEENNEELYGKLDPEYINDYNVTMDNVITKIKLIENYNIDEYDYYKFYIDNMNVSKYKDIETYFVTGRIINSNTGEKNKVSVLVELDKNSYYYIIPEGLIKDKKISIEEGNNYNTHLSSIESTSYNQYELQEVNDYSLILDHMSKLVADMTYDIENSYNTLDNEYRNEKFSNSDDYKNYITKNFSTILASSIEKYKINEMENEKEYICIDQYGNYYIFKDNGVMNYTVKFDTYTINTEEFNNKYDNGSEQLKVGMNLEKVFQALNRKDYDYIYEKLDSTFKQNNFKTLEDFEKFAKENFNDINKFEYGKFQEQSGVYIYEILISDAQEKVTDDKEENNEQTSEDKIQKNFVVKLEDNREFKFAFNIN